MRNFWYLLCLPGQHFLWWTREKAFLKGNYSPELTITRQFEHNCVFVRGSKALEFRFLQKVFNCASCVATEDALISVQTPLLSLFFVVVIFTPHRKGLSESHALCNRA